MKHVNIHTYIDFFKQALSHVQYVFEGRIGPDDIQQRCFDRMNRIVDIGKGSGEIAAKALAVAYAGNMNFDYDAQKRLSEEVLLNFSRPKHSNV